ncbi:MAG: hypothetical protein GTO62_09810, partial [Planctomycetales bacterium]|nr:hypothetical protein [Planctomycetales bacterium]
LRGKDFSYSNLAKGFDRVYAYASDSGAPDTAYLYGSTAHDRFYQEATYSIVRGGQFEFFNYASGFDRVFTYPVADADEERS